MNTTTHRKAWSCEICHAINVGARCGCKPALAPVSTLDQLNAIALVIAPRKARKV